MELRVSQLVEYAVRKGWIQNEDRIYAANRILKVIGADGFSGLIKVEELPEIQDILNGLCDIAYENGVIEGRSAAYYDLLDTELMGLFTPWPSQIIAEFRSLYSEDPKKATDWYYAFSQDTNYIRRERIKKDAKFKDLVDNYEYTTVIIARML